MIFDSKLESMVIQLTTWRVVSLVKYGGNKPD